ncbi:hypothetical protein KKA24_02400 [Patescibacteria group bacterium]|nr:hypothetical protein [Patescibacteria group bacterium]
MAERHGEEYNFKGESVEVSQLEKLNLGKEETKKAFLQAIKNHPTSCPEDSWVVVDKKNPENEEGSFISAGCSIEVIPGKDMDLAILGHASDLFEMFEEDEDYKELKKQLGKDYPAAWGAEVEKKQ